MIDQKESIKYIQNQLGHSIQNVTLSVYAHLMIGTVKISALILPTPMPDDKHQLTTSRVKSKFN